MSGCLAEPVVIDRDNPLLSSCKTGSNENVVCKNCSFKNKKQRMLYMRFSLIHSWNLGIAKMFHWNSVLIFKN